MSIEVNLEKQFNLHWECESDHISLCCLSVLDSSMSPGKFKDIVLKKNGIVSARISIPNEALSKLSEALEDLS